jgi:hypothetical protein
MLIAFLVVLGRSHPRPPVDLFPNVDFPIVTVTTTPPAPASKRWVGVTKRIEEAVNTSRASTSCARTTGISRHRLPVQERDSRKVRRTSTTLGDLHNGAPTRPWSKFDVELADPGACHSASAICG